MRGVSWHRADGESWHAFEAFQVYLDLGPGRTIRDAFRQATNNPDAGQAEASWKVWPQKYHWEERAKASDQHLERIKQNVLDKATAKSAEVWAARRDKQLEDDYVASQKMIRRAKQLISFPVVDRQKSADGKTVQIKAISIQDYKRSCEIYDAARLIAHGTIGRSLPAQTVAPLTPILAASMRPDIIEEARRENAEWRREQMENIIQMRRTNPMDSENSSTDAPPTPPSLANGTV